MVNVTVFGKSCIAWNITRPNLHWHHNYCRNPDPSALSPWCYVNTQRMEYCDVPKCESLISCKLTLIHIKIYILYIKQHIAHTNV